MKVINLKTLSSISGAGIRISPDSFKKAAEWAKKAIANQLAKPVTKSQKPQTSSAPYSQQPASAPASRTH